MWRVVISVETHAEIGLPGVKVENRFAEIAEEKKNCENEEKFFASERGRKVCLINYGGKGNHSLVDADDKPESSDEWRAEPDIESSRIIRRKM